MLCPGPQHGLAWPSRGVAWPVCALSLGVRTLAMGGSRHAGSASRWPQAVFRLHFGRVGARGRSCRCARSPPRGDALAKSATAVGARALLSCRHARACVPQCRQSGTHARPRACLFACAHVVRARPRALRLVGALRVCRLACMRALVRARSHAPVRARMRGRMRAGAHARVRARMTVRAHARVRACAPMRAPPRLVACGWVHAPARRRAAAHSCVRAATQVGQFAGVRALVRGIADASVHRRRTSWWIA